MNLILACVVTIVTAYAPIDHTSINCDGDCSRTATGERPGPHIAACGPGWQLSDTLYVAGYGPVRCGDRYGSPPHPLAVEVWQPSVRAALRWGWRTGQVVCRLPPVRVPPEPTYQKGLTKIR